MIAFWFLNFDLLCSLNNQRFQSGAEAHAIRFTHTPLQTQYITRKTNMKSLQCCPKLVIGNLSITPLDLCSVCGMSLSTRLDFECICGLEIRKKQCQHNDLWEILSFIEDILFGIEYMIRKHTNTHTHESASIVQLTEQISNIDTLCATSKYLDEACVDESMCADVYTAIDNHLQRRRMVQQ